MEPPTRIKSNVFFSFNTGLSCLMLKISTEHPLLFKFSSNPLTAFSVVPYLLA